MSLKPTDRNRVFGSLLSAQDWARQAVGSDKRSGEVGFEGFRSGEWMHFLHYRKLRSDYPGQSPKEALPEMSEMRQRIVEDIMSSARDIDSMIMRLQRMEEQMQEVVETEKEVTE